MWLVNGSHCRADPLLVHCTSFYGGRTLGARHSCRVRTAQCGDVVRKEELLLASDILVAAACLGYRVGQAPQEPGLWLCRVRMGPWDWPGWAGCFLVVSEASGHILKT